MLKLHVVCPGMSAALRNQVQSFLSHHTNKQMKMLAWILWMLLMEKIIISHKKWCHTVISQYFSGNLSLRNFQWHTAVLLSVLRKYNDKLFRPYDKVHFFVCFLTDYGNKIYLLWHWKVTNDFNFCTLLCTRK